MTHTTAVQGVDLTESALMSKACQKTGLSDWGDETFRVPLRIYLNDLEASAGLHRFGQSLMQRVLMRLLTNRLKMQRDFSTFPEILETPINRPLYVLGFPRTGSTLLHNLLACDPNARYLRFCEGLYPSPPPDPHSWQSDSRLVVADKYVAMFNRIAPQMATAHALNSTGPEECLWLFEHTFVDLMYELRTNVSAYTAWNSEHESDLVVYREYRRMVQLLGWRWPGKHWVFKAPRHLFGLKGLLAVFPDARIVQTHRELSEVLPSLCSLCEINRKIFSDKLDRNEIGGFWFNRLKYGLQKALAIREADEQERYLDIHYRELLANPIKSVQRIYDFHNYEYSPAFESAMLRWMKNNPQHKHGKHRYRLQDYGLQAHKIDTAFAEYCEKFDI